MYHRRILLFFIAFFVFLMTFFASIAWSESQTRLFSPLKDYTGQPRFYTIIASSEIRAAVIILVENSAGVSLFENIPMLVEGGICATTQTPVILPEPGDYRFHVGLTSRTEDETGFFVYTILSEPAPGILQNIVLSNAPYYVGHSLEVRATFTALPESADVELLVSDDRHPVETVSNDAGLEVVGYISPLQAGEQEVVLSWTDPNTKTPYLEFVPFYAGVYERNSGDTIIRENESGGGCESGVGTVGFFPILLLFALLAFPKRGLLCLALVASLLFGNTALAATYLVQNDGDDLYFPPQGSFRSIWQTIELLGSKNDIIQFAPSVETIELKGVLELSNGVKLDAYTGRSGKRVTLTLASGGYRHLKSHSSQQDDFSVNGIIFKGFGIGDPRNSGIQNGGMEFRGGGAKFENCQFIDIAGRQSAVLMEVIETDVIMDKCLFQGNKAEENGGALSLSAGNLLLDRTFVGQNKAKYDGGAFYNQGTSSEAGQWASVHNTIVNNQIDASRFTYSSISAPKVGNRKPMAGAFPTASNLILKQSKMIENESDTNGGAASVQGLVMCNSTVYGNIAGQSAGVIGGISPQFYATLIANNIETQQNAEEDSSWNLNAVPYDENADAPTLAEVFEPGTSEPEDRGGYTPVMPIRYAGPGDGRVSQALFDKSGFADHPLDFRSDARGVLRNYEKGASIGAYEFGIVSLLPGNNQNSTTIAFKPNDSGQIKVKLVETVNSDSLAMTNYLAEIPIDFNLTQGKSIESLPQAAKTADNGRAAVTVNTLSSGDSTVQASVKNKPSLFLDLLIRIGDFTVAPPATEPPVAEPTEPTPVEVDDDLYVVILNPNQTKVDTENIHVATYSRACVSSTVSIRLKGYTETIESNLPITISDSIYGTIEKPLSFPRKGMYMFDFKMTDTKGRTYEDTKELKVADDTSSLKVFRLSEPPYYEEKTFSLMASFTKAPKEIDMTIVDETGKEYKPMIRSQNERLNWEGFFTPDEPGGYTAHLEYVDGGDSRSHSERFMIQVAKYYGESGDVIIERSESGGGCNISRFGILLSICLLFLFCLNKLVQVREKIKPCSHVHAFFYNISWTILFLCVIAVVWGMLYYPSYGSRYLTKASYVSREVSKILTRLVLVYRPIAEEYIRKHERLNSQEILSLPVPDSSLPYFYLINTPNATWVGEDLTQCYSIEPWWKEFWEGGSVNLDIRMRLEKKAFELNLCGSENIMTPPLSNDVKFLYKKADNVVWFQTDQLSEF